MITKYHHNNIDYNTFDEIRQLFPNVSFPETITSEALEPLGITIVQEADPVRVPTQEEIVDGYVAQVQEYLDATAQSRGYDSIFTLCSYANDYEPNPKFLKEGKAAVIWRSAVWTKCYAILEEVQAGSRNIPNDIISELPVFTWGD